MRFYRPLCWLLFFLAGPVWAETAVTVTDLKESPVLESPVLSGRAETPVIRQELPKISADAVGLAWQQVTLPLEFWRGFDYATAVFLVSNLPNAVTSPNLRRMQNTLLLAPTRPPEAQANPAPEPNSLLQQRLRKLWQSGQWVEFSALADALPQGVASVEVERNAVLAQMISGQADAACAKTDALALLHAEDEFWHEAQIVCLARAKKTEQIRLQQDLWLEKNPKADQEFHALVRKFLNDTKPRAAITAAFGPWHYLLAMQQGFAPTNAWPIKFIQHQPVLQVIALNSALLPPGDKIALAEKMLLGGVIAPRKLTEIYGLLPKTAAADKNPPVDFIRRARDFQSWQGLADALAQAHRLVELWQNATTDTQKRLWAASIWPWLGAQSPGADLAFFAPYAVRAAILLADGNPALAASLWPYLYLDGKSTADAPTAQSWQESRLSQKPQSLESQQAAIAALGQALGLDKSPLPAPAAALNAQILSLQPGMVPNPALWQAWITGQQNKSPAADIIYPLFLLPPDNVSAVAMPVLLPIIAALRQQNLADWAKTLAMEYLVLQNI
jgi:hypothetical protein